MSKPAATPTVLDREGARAHLNNALQALVLLEPADPDARDLVNTAVARIRRAVEDLNSADDFLSAARSFVRDPLTTNPAQDMRYAGNALRLVALVLFGEAHP